MSEDIQQHAWKHVVWVKVSTYRTDATDKLVKHRRLVRQPVPAVGSSFEAYAAELGEYAKEWYVRLFDAHRVGMPLVAQKALAVWNDAGKVSKTKALEYALAHTQDEPFRTLLSKGQVENAKAAAEMKLSAGPGANGQANVSDADAEREDRLFKAHMDAATAATRAKMFPMSKPQPATASPTQ